MLLSLLAPSLVLFMAVPGHFVSAGAPELDAASTLQPAAAAAAEMQPALRESRCVLTMGDGDRPWFESITRPRLAAYAASMGASFEVVSGETLRVPPIVVEAYTRSPVGTNPYNNTAYVRKMLAVATALARCDRVLWLDDSVFAHEGTPDIFAACGPNVSLCSYSEGTSACPTERFTYSMAASYLGRLGMGCARRQYLNTGVTVFSQASRRYLTDAALADGMPFFGVAYATEQAYLCAMLGVAGDVPQLLDRAWNFIPFPNCVVADEGERDAGALSAIAPLMDARQRTPVPHSWANSRTHGPAVLNAELVRNASRVHLFHLVHFFSGGAAGDRMGLLRQLANDL